jgi:type IV pilus assembly protein PilB
MVNPSNLMAFDDVRRYVQGVIIEPRVCTDDEFGKFMTIEYSKLMNLEPSDMELQTASGDAPVVRLANNILALTIKQGASDIHIEPQEQGGRLRLRIDGVLRVENILSKKTMLPLTSRVKILSKLDISERRLPQDGRISIKIDDRAIDFRVSTIPTKYGEKIVMRVLDKSASLLPLDLIINHTETMEKVRNMIKEPYGIIYVTGTTGSDRERRRRSIVLSERSTIRARISRPQKTRSSTTWKASTRSRNTKASASTSPASYAPFCVRTRTSSLSVKPVTVRLPRSQ